MPEYVKLRKFPYPMAKETPISERKEDKMNQLGTKTLETQRLVLRQYTVEDAYGYACFRFYRAFYEQTHLPSSVSIQP